MRKFLTGFFFTMLLSLSSVTLAATSPVVFANGFGTGWGNWSWNITLNPTKQPGYANANSAGVTYNTTWAGFSLGAPSNFSTTGYKHLSFMVKNDQNGDDLWIFATNSANVSGPALPLKIYSPKYGFPDTGFPVGQWIWVKVPIKDLGLGNNPTLSYFVVQSAKANAIVDFDEMRFDANATLFESLTSDGMTTPTLRGPGFVWHWGSDVLYPEDSGYADLVVNVTAPWGGVQIQDVIGGATLPSADYSAVAMLLCSPTESTNPPKTYATLISDANTLIGNYVVLNNYKISYFDAMIGVGKNIVKTCCNLLVPLAAFGVNASNPENLGGIAITSEAPGWFSFNSVRFVEGLKFPLSGKTATTAGISAVMDHSMTDYACPDGVVTAFTGEQGRQEFGISTWSFATYNSFNACPGAQLHAYKKAVSCTSPSVVCSFWLQGQNANTGTNGEDKLWLYYDGHPGIDYVASFVPVYATASGVISSSTCHSGTNGRTCTGFGVVKIEHGHSIVNLGAGQGYGLITSYNHLSSVLAGITEGTYVFKGQQIGVSGSTGVSSPHLHISTLWSPAQAFGDIVAPQYVDPYGWKGSYSDPYQNAKNVCLWDTGC